MENNFGMNAIRNSSPLRLFLGRFGSLIFYGLVSNERKCLSQMRVGTTDIINNRRQLVFLLFFFVVKFWCLY